MNIIEVNITYNIGSTGRIVCDLQRKIESAGYHCYVLAGYSTHGSDSVYTMYANYPTTDQYNTIVNRVSGLTGYRHKLRTQKAIQWIESKKPDLIHLHNIHGDWIHIPTLINYIVERGIPVVWTLHDCWSFTGRCSYFELNGCSKWKNGCYDCKYRNVYPITYLNDFSKFMWKQKHELFTKMKNLTIVTPSQWLAEYVKESYLDRSDIKVIHNGINTDVFKPLMDSTVLPHDQSLRYILGVANSWSERKGLIDFLRLNENLDHSKYKLVLVGLNDSQMKTVPNDILKIHRTTSATQLAEIYSMADVYVNATYQDNYPTTNLEALCCGCPVVTYDTGGSKESLFPDAGVVVPKGDIMALQENAIALSSENRKLRGQRSEAARAIHGSELCYQKYIDLFRMKFGE